MDDSPYPAKAPRRKRSYKSSLEEECTASYDDAKRIPMACVSCRKRKIRCDGAQPSCNNCTRGSKHACRYERVSAEENLQVKMRKRLAKLRKEHGPQLPEDPSSQLGSRRRWSRTLSLDSGMSMVGPPPATSSDSVPFLSPSSSGLSSAARNLSLESPAGHPVYPHAQQGYFDHPGSTYPITPIDESAGEYSVGGPDVTNPMYAPKPASSAGSPYPLTPPTDDAYACGGGVNCTCRHPAPVVAHPQAHYPPPSMVPRRPAFAHSQTAPQPITAPYGMQYTRVPFEAANYPPEVPLALSLPNPPTYLTHPRGEISAPTPVRTVQQPSFIRADYSAAQVVAASVPRVFTPYRSVAVRRDPFLSPDRPANWADAFIDDPLLDRTAAYTEMWLGEQSKTAAPVDEYSNFEQSTW